MGAITTADKQAADSTEEELPGCFLSLSALPFLQGLPTDYLGSFPHCVNKLTELFRAFHPLFSKILAFFTYLMFKD